MTIRPFICATALVAAFQTSAAWAACTDADTGCKLTLQADATPSDQPWNQPARVAYTFNNDGKDSFAVDVSGKGVFDLGLPPQLFGLAELTWHKNNQQKKQQNNFQIAAGLHFEHDTAPAEGSFDADRLFSLWVDTKIAYNRKAVYADKTKPACVLDETAAVCRTQHVGSLRATVDISPFWGFFESEQSYSEPGPNGSSTGKMEGPTVAHSFGLVGTIFHDDIMENKLDPDTGKRITGAVSGVKGKAGFALSPKFSDYRLVLRGDAQLVRAVSRDALRRDDFGRSTHLITVSLDFDLSDRSFLKGEKGFKPSVGLTYTDGSDPLTGREDQSSWVVGLKVAFK